MTNTELEYMLDLAGVQHPVAAYTEIDLTVPEPVAALMDNLEGVAATVTDRIFTPLRWNALSEAIHHHSRHRLPVDRNWLVRALLDPEFAELLGDERERLITKAVGVFRLNHSSVRPSPLLGAVYEKIKREPLFLKAWNQRIVSHDLTGDRVTTRMHAEVGRLAAYAADLSSWSYPDLFIRTLAPADAEAAAKFEHIAALARSRAETRSKMALV